MAEFGVDVESGQGGGGHGGEETAGILAVDLENVIWTGVDPETGGGGAGVGVGILYGCRRGIRCHGGAWLRGCVGELVVLRSLGAENQYGGEVEGE